MMVGDTLESMTFDKKYLQPYVQWIQVEIDAPP